MGYSAFSPVLLNLTHKTADRLLNASCVGTSCGNQLFCVNHYRAFCGGGALLYLHLNSDYFI